MWRHPRFAVLTALAVAITATACSGSTQQAMSPMPQLRVPTGTVYLAMGKKELAADLYSVTTSGGPPRRLHHFQAGGADWLTASNGLLVIASPVKIVDTLEKYSHGKLTPFISGSGYAPNLSPSGQLAYTSLLPNPANTMALKVASRPGAHPRQIATFPIHDNPAVWVLNGSKIAIFGDHGSSVSLLSPETGQHTRNFRIPRSSDMYSSERNLVACYDNDPAHGATILNVKSGAISRTPPGWAPLNWSPDGTRLLATDTSRRHLGAIDATHPTHVQKLPGISPQPIWTAAWASQ